MTRVGALWIGGLEPYMDEKFLTNAMMALGQEGVVSIKVMTNKFTGEPAGYGFINFESDHRAILTMHRLGGKVKPVFFSIWPFGNTTGETGLLVRKTRFFRRLFYVKTPSPFLRNWG